MQLPARGPRRSFPIPGASLHVPWRPLYSPTVGSFNRGRILLYALGHERGYPNEIGGEEERRVLHDLIRALPIAVLVCLVPGWFWARLLSASADRAEQIAYSVALAITLVPTVALVLARILDRKSVV